MFPNSTRKRHNHTTMDIVNKVVGNVIRRNNNTSNTSSQKRYSVPSSVLRKEDIYRSLEKAYNSASRFK